MFKRTTAINKISRMRKFYRVIQGGTSAGKTYAIMAILIDYAIKNPNKIIDVVSMTYKHLSQGSIMDFKKIMMTTNRWVDKNWHKTEHTYKFSNGTIIRFLWVDEGGARGPRRDVLYLNEATHFDFETYEQLSSRTSNFIYIDYNPSNRFWVHDEIIGSDNCDYLCLNYKDNEAIPSNVFLVFDEWRKKALEGSKYYQNKVRVYIDGEIGKLEGAIYQNWSLIDDIPEDAELLGYGLDFGFTNDPSACIAVYKWNGKMILHELLYTPNKRNDELAEILLPIVDKYKPIYCDSAEPKSIADLSYKGLRTYKATKGPDSILHGISVVQQYELLVTKSSTNLIDELYKYKWSEKEGSLRNQPVDKDNHACDAFRYFFQTHIRGGLERGGLKITRV